MNHNRTSPQKSSKTALVLSGGGSRGAYQIGVWQALRELGIRLDLVAGTSVGALNAAMIVQDDFDVAQKIWASLTTDMIFDVDVKMQELSAKNVLGAMGAFTKEFVEKGGADPAGLKELLSQLVSEDKVRSSPIDFGLVTVKMQNLEPCKLFKEDMAQGSLIDYMIASAACFPAVRSHTINNQRYIDGGYYDNMPVQMAVDRGATEIIAVDLNAIGVSRPTTIPDGVTVRNIQSQWDLGNFLLFDQTSIKRNMRLGYLDTLKSYGAFDGSCYTFLKGSLLSVTLIEKQQIYRSFNKLGVRLFDNTPTVLADLARKKAEQFIKSSTGQRAAYPALLLTAAEAAASIFSLNPATLYTKEKFQELLFEQVDAYKQEFNRILQEQKIVLTKLKLADIPALFSYLNTKTLTLVLAALIRRELAKEQSANFAPLLPLKTKEFFAAFYLATAQEE